MRRSEIQGTNRTLRAALAFAIPSLIAACDRGMTQQPDAAEAGDLGLPADLVDLGQGLLDANGVGAEEGEPPPDAEPADGGDTSAPQDANLVDASGRDASSPQRLIGPGSMAFSPSISAHAGAIYLVINCGGARRSLDFGATWSFGNLGLDYGSFGEDADDLHAIAAHPASPSVVLAAGKTGILRSEDSALSWRLVLPVRVKNIDTFAFDPANPDRVCAGSGWLDGNYPTEDITPAEGQLWCSLDGGQTFVETSPIAPSGQGANVYSLAIAPGGPVYAATHLGAFVSADEGQTWTKLLGLPHDLIASVRVDRRDPPAVGLPQLFAVLLTDRSGRGGVFHSADGGATWQDRSSDLEPPAWREGTGKEISRAVHYVDLEQHPSRGATFYVTSLAASGQGGVWRTEDDGQRWTRITGDANLAPSWGALEGGITAFDLSIDRSNPDAMAFTAFGETQGYRTLDGGATWVPLHTMQVAPGAIPPRFTNLGSESYKFAIGLHPSDPRVIVLGAGDHGAFRSEDGGESFARVAPRASDATRIRFSPVNPMRVYLGSEQVGRNLWVSEDSGVTFRQREQTGAGAVWDVAPHPALEAVAFAATEHGGLRVTDDGGMTWSAASGLAATDVRAIRVRESAPRTWFAVGDGAMWSSDDDGQAWIRAADLGDPDLRGLAVLDDAIVIAARSGIFQSAIGPPWLFERALEVRGTEVTGRGAFVAAASQGEGLWVSTLGGRPGTWDRVETPWSSDLRHLALDPLAPLLYASAKCAGTWRIPLPFGG